MIEINIYILLLGVFFFLIAGLFEGAAEALKFHTPKFFERFKKANKQFWDPSLSWYNKYKNGDPAQGPKFFQSTQFFVGFTDGYHLLRLFRNIFTILAILTFPALNYFWMLPAYIVLYLAFTGGFTISYDILF